MLSHPEQVATSHSPVHAAGSPADADVLLQPPSGWRRFLAFFTRHISGKIIAPYLVLVFILAVFATYVVMNLVTTSLEEKFRSQLADAGRAANEAMVKIESDHLKVYRQMAFTEGVAERLGNGEAQELQQLLVPIQANSQVGYVDVLDTQGNLLMVLRPPELAAEAATLIDMNAGSWRPVQRVLNREEDVLGDKFSAIVQATWGPMLYTAGPVFQGDQFVGVIAVGTPLDSAIARLSQEAIAGVSVYAPSGALVASTLPGADATLAVTPDVHQRIMASGEEVRQRTISVGASRYQEMLGILEVRREPAMLMGVSQSVSLISDKGAETRNTLIALFSLVTFFVLLTGLVLARKLTRPIMLLVEGCRRLAAGDLSSNVPLVSKDETGLLTVTFNQTLEGLRERDRAKDAFGRYMSPELYEAIQRGELKLGGEKRDITIIMSDIRGFTTISEAMDPEDLVAFLNRYFENQVAAIQRYGGTIDKYMGDAILAKFGAPIWYPDHAERAALALIEMRMAVEEFNRENEAMGISPIRIGIGANSGPAVVGNIGSIARMEYTIIGDAVNATQRIEDLCKEFKWDLLMSDTTYERAKAVVEVGHPHPITLRGRQQQTLVYPILCAKVGVDLSVHTASRHVGGNGATENGAVHHEREAAEAAVGR